MDYDDLLKTLGEFGRYQKLIFFLVCLLSIPGALNNLSIVFLAAVPAHHCSVPSAEHLNVSEDELLNLTIPLVKDEDGRLGYAKCEQYDRDYSDWTRERFLEDLSNADKGTLKTVKCREGWTYNTSTYKSTIVTEWDLVCDRKALVPTASSIYMAGLLVGVAVFGAISDWFGRRAAIIPGIILMSTFAISASFSQNYATFVILRFLNAGASIGLFTTSFVLGIELVGPSWRAFAGLVGLYFWVMGYLLIAGIAYGLRDWRHLALALSAPQLLCLILIFLLPESPRWLYSRNKHERGDVIVRRMAKFNKVDLPDKIDVQLTEKAQAYICDIFRLKRMMLRTLNICFNWFVNSLVYYGLSLNTSNFGGDDYVDFFASGLVEIPAYIFCQVSLRYIGRKKSLTGTMVAGGVFLLLTVTVPQSPHYFVTIRIVLAMLGKMCIAASFAIIYVFSAELFPTVVRNMGVSAGSVCARIGGILAPYILLTGLTGSSICFGVLSIAAGLLGLLLPETRNQRLPETLQDGENFPNLTPKDPDPVTEPPQEPPPSEQEPQRVSQLDIGFTNPCLMLESNI